MTRVLDMDDDECFDRMVTAIKLMEENVITAFVQQIRDSSFLTEDEKSKLKEQKENIPITLMEPCGDESKMLLRQWNLKSSSTYVLHLVEESLRKESSGIIKEIQNKTT
ncbi:hypothetical protein GH714_021651 [Hevea brasiliensis]|uniref:Uncharacterized protein n=1 Tax=Hevea brasiliensis TaxID=3981 RepID=A0A6A6KTP5_HEVBR|nr:hypothetical protein GH714_021651 [Hevea brasiliensis]